MKELKMKALFSQVQIETNSASISEFRFDERSRDVALIKERIINGDFSRPHQLGALVPELLASSRHSERRLIVSLHSGLCATIQAVATVRRTIPSKQINDSELESIISSALWKSIGSKKSELAIKLGVTESLLTPVSALILKTRVDGHRVATPVGFRAHTVEFTFLYTIISKELYSLLTPLLHAEVEPYVVETGISELMSLAAKKEKKDVLLVRVSEKYTYVYRADEDGCSYHDTIQWGRSSLIASLINRFMISELQALELLRRVEENLVSSHASRKLQGILLEEAAVLLKAVGVHARALDVVYVESPFVLPEGFLKQHISQKAGITTPLLLMPNNPHGEKGKTALSLHMKSNAPSLAALSAHATAAVRFFSLSDLDKIAKRRVRWLASSVIQ